MKPGILNSNFIRCIFPTVSKGQRVREKKNKINLKPRVSVCDHWFFFCVLNGQAKNTLLLGTGPYFDRDLYTFVLWEEFRNSKKTAWRVFFKTCCEKLSHNWILKTLKTVQFNINLNVIWTIKCIHQVWSTVYLSDFFAQSKKKNIWR